MSLKQLIEELKKTPGVAEQKMKAKVVKSGPFKSEVKLGRHKLVLDEEKVIGGTNEGPAPSQVLLAALGGCLLSTMQAWSQILEIKINAVEVNITGTLNIFGMLGIDEDISPGYQEIVVDLTIDSPESPEKVKELVDIVEKHCPVNCTITNPTKVKLKIKSKA